MSDQGLKHIMISYEHGVQNEVKKLKERLNKMGHKVWIDLESMRGDTVTAMMRAVEEAYIFMPVLTEGYEKSKNCKKEFVYAEKKGKEIIPVIIATKYRPKDWISFYLENTYFYNLLKEDEDAKFEKLLKEKVAQLVENEAQGQDTELDKAHDEKANDEKEEKKDKREEQEEDTDGGQPDVKALALILRNLASHDLATVSQPIHEGVMCDSCGELDFAGPRYICCVCENYDLCESCHAKQRLEVHERRHVFIKFRIRNDNAHLLVANLRQAATNFAKTIHLGNNVHKHMQCNKCRDCPIVGNMYKCLVCEDFDLCMPCEDDSSGFHDDAHPMIVFCHPASSYDQGDFYNVFTTSK